MINSPSDQQYRSMWRRVDYGRMAPLPPKRLVDGRAFLNLGCGFRTHPAFNNLDFGAYARLRRHPFLARTLRAVGFLSDERWANLAAVDPEIVVWDLRRGIPFADGTFDLVYHSHLLEHIDRSEAPGFLRECHRVLRPGGVLRVAVPDLEQSITRYRETLGGIDIAAHQRSVEALYEQFVRTVTADSLKQRPWVRAVEHLVRRDPSQTGELHRWMYDRVTLSALLESVGFHQPIRRSATESAVIAWAQFHLDSAPDGAPRLPGSLYLEALH